MFKKYIKAYFLSFVFTMFLPSAAFAAFIGNDVNMVAENIVETTDLFPALIAGFCYIAGLLIAVTAILKTIEHVSNPNQTPIRTPIVRFLVGGALFSLPIVLEAALRTIGVGNFDPDIGPLFAASGLAGILTGSVINTTINAMLAWIVLGIDALPGLVSAISYLLGLLMVVSGIFHVRDHVEDPDRVQIRQPVIRLLIGGALFALPVIFQAMFEVISNGGLGVMGTALAVLNGVMLIYSTEAGIACGLGAFIGTTLGDAMCHTLLSVATIPAFLNALAYLIGMVFGVWGLFKIRDHVINPSQTPLSEGIMRLVAGGCFFSLPVLAVVFNTTVTPIFVTGWAIAGTNYGFANDSLSCGTTNSLDEAMGCFMTNILGPTHVLLNFFCYCAGLIFIMIGISRLVRSSQEGAKGPGGLGTISTFVTGALLFSATNILRTLSSSMFADSQTKTFATLTYTGGMSATETQAAYNIINAVLRFMIMIGMISFVRGLFIMRDVSEGNSQASTMAGMTHIVGGALAVNLGPLLNVIQGSLGITAFGVQFGI